MGGDECTSHRSVCVQVLGSTVKMENALSSDYSYLNFACILLNSICYHIFNHLFW